MKELTGPVQQFVAQLTDSDREMLMAAVQDSVSLLDVWCLATALGYRGGMGAFSDWVRVYRRFEDRFNTLSSEITKLQADLQNLRAGLTPVDERNADAPPPIIIDADKGLGRVAALSKELRGYVVELEKMTRNVDRHDLLLTGANIALSEIRSIFHENQEVLEALSAVELTVWSIVRETK